MLLLVLSCRWSWGRSSYCSGIGGIWVDIDFCWWNLDLGGSHNLFRCFGRLLCLPWQSSGWPNTMCPTGDFLVEWAGRKYWKRKRKQKDKPNIISTFFQGNGLPCRTLACVYPWWVFMAKFWYFGGNSNICLSLGLWDLKHLFAQFGHFFKLLAIKEFETDPVRIMWSIPKIDVDVDGNVVADVFSEVDQ